MKTAGTTMACRVAARRARLFGNPDWNGIDYLDVSDDQLSLCVHFFGRVPEGITAAQVRIEGGRRVRDIRVLEVRVDHADDPELDDCLHVSLDRFGDFSTYRLCLLQTPTPHYTWPAAMEMERPPPLAGLDPRYACVDFSFKPDCPSDLDCPRPPQCAPELAATPELNYLAKDYASLRQLIYDRLAYTMPQWRERHAPDLGVTLVELLAYAGDQLSYYQDAVATEAYLETARLRVSVRRHARLADYRMHEGTNARAWMTVWTDTDLDPIPAQDIYFITGLPDLPATSGRVLRASDLDYVPPSLYEVYEPLVEPDGAALRFRAAHSVIAFHTWGDQECCLPKGATRAALVDRGAGSRREGGRVLELQPGDILILAEVLGPTTGLAADAHPGHRQAVRLTRVTPGMDGLLGTPVLEVEWAAQDALRFSLCLSSRLAAPDCRRVGGVGVALGNTVLVDHGRSHTATLGPVPVLHVTSECACEDSVLEGRVLPRRWRPELDGAPLTFAVPLRADAPAAALAVQDARAALPRVALRELVAGDPTGPVWTAQADLLASAAGARDFVAEIDDEGQARLRFGDGDLGRMPAAGVAFQACYRIGNGPSGNVGCDTIRYMVMRTGTLSAGAILPTNPLPAMGGTPPEPVAEARLLAPLAFRTQLQRAITADDYAQLAQRDPRIQRAAAELRWMGSWYEAHVALDPLGAEHAAHGLRAAMAQRLYRYRRMGHDLALASARLVPIALTMQVCVQAHYARAAVLAALRDAFGTGRLPDGSLGAFHPDNLSFGQGIYVSRLVASAMAVAGVQTVAVLRLVRLDAPAPPDLPPGGVLPMAAQEIAQLDNDPNFPEHGKLELILKGGV